MADDKANTTNTTRSSDEAPIATNSSNKASVDPTQNIKIESTSTETEAQTFSEAVREQAIEGERPESTSWSLRKILAGDLLTANIIRQHLWLIILIGVFMLIYISNRYSYQQDIIKIDKLQHELQDAKYKALSTTSELTEQSRESNVLKLLKENQDSTLKRPNQPPYMINIPDNEQ